MRNLVTTVLVLCSAIVNAQQSYFEMPLGAREKVLTSLTTPDHHYYVTLGIKDKYNTSGYDVSKGVTIVHFDQDMKMLTKVKTKPLKNGKLGFSILSMIALGDTIAFVGSSVDYNLSTESIGLIVVDKKTLTPEKKVTEINSHKVRLLFGVSNNKTKVSFKQNTEGGAAAFKIEFTEEKETGPGRSLLTIAYDFVMVKRNLRVTEILFLSSRDDRKDYDVNDYYLARTGDLYIHVDHSKQIEPGDGERWWDSEEYRAQVGNAPHFSTIYQYRGINLVNETTFSFSNKQLSGLSTRFYETSTDIYIGGVAGNGLYNYKRILRHDTLNMSEDFEIFFASKLTGDKELVIPASSCFVIEGEIKKMLEEEQNLSARDEEMGANVYSRLNFFSITIEGQFVFTGAKCVAHYYPLYESIKNDKRYTFTKDDNGKITHVEGPGDFFAMYYSLYTVKLNADFTSPQVTFTEFNAREERDFGSNASLMDNIYQCSSSSAAACMYYCNPGSEGNVYYWNGENKASTLNFHPKGQAYIQCPSSANSYPARFTVVSEKSYWVVKGSE